MSSSNHTAEIILVVVILVILLAWFMTSMHSKTAAPPVQEPCMHPYGAQAPALAPSRENNRSDALYNERMRKLKGMTGSASVASRTSTNGNAMHASSAGLTGSTVAVSDMSLFQPMADAPSSEATSWPADRVYASGSIAGGMLPGGSKSAIEIADAYRGSITRNVNRLGQAVVNTTSRSAYRSNQRGERAGVYAMIDELCGGGNEPAVPTMEQCQAKLRAGLNIPESDPCWEYSEAYQTIVRENEERELRPGVMAYRGLSQPKNGVNVNLLDMWSDEAAPSPPAVPDAQAFAGVDDYERDLAEKQAALAALAADATERQRDNAQAMVDAAQNARDLFVARRDCGAAGHSWDAARNSCMVPAADATPPGSTEIVEAGNSTEGLKTNGSARWFQR